MAINIRGNKNNVQGTVIAVDQLLETVRFCAMGKDGSLVTNSFNYTVRPFDKDFYDRLTEILKQQMEKNPNMDMHKVSLILPDQLFLLDMVTIPVIHRKAMENSLNLAIETIYKNADEMNLITYTVQRNKQVATYGLVGSRRDLLDEIRKTFLSSGVTVSGVTYASNATVNGAMALSPKLRNETFMLMDIKENCTRFAFVVRGCTMGYYDLPFGYGILYNSQPADEGALFNHRPGELLVLNAKKRARAKQLTIEGEDYEESIAPTNAREPHEVMQRPSPQTKEEYIYDNFRIFLKWALELLDANREIADLAKMDTVYVNMPSEYRFIFDIISEKRQGHNITFAPLLAEEGLDSTAVENLDLYGGFFINKFNEANTF